MQYAMCSAAAARRQWRMRIMDSRSTLGSQNLRLRGVSVGQEPETCSLEQPSAESLSYSNLDLMQMEATKPRRDTREGSYLLWR